MQTYRSLCLTHNLTKRALAPLVRKVKHDPSLRRCKTPTHDYPVAFCENAYFHFFSRSGQIKIRFELRLLLNEAQILNIFICSIVNKSDLNRFAEFFTGAPDPDKKHFVENLSRYFPKKFSISLRDLPKG